MFLKALYFLWKDYTRKSDGMFYESDFHGPNYGYHDANFDLKKQNPCTLHGKAVVAHIVLIIFNKIRMFIIISLYRYRLKYSESFSLL